MMPKSPYYFMNTYIRGIVEMSMVSDWVLRIGYCDLSFNTRIEFEEQ